MTNSDDPTDEDLEATIEAGGEAEQVDTLLVCQWCKESELIHKIQNSPKWFCSVCGREFMPNLTAG